MTLPLAMPRNVAAVTDEAIRLFVHDLDRYADEVLDAFGPLAQHELDGWTSWHYNTGGAHSSSAVKLWRGGDKRGAIVKMRQWNKVTVGGKKQVSAALDVRREQEANLILRGTDTAPRGTIPIWPTDGAGRVKWRTIGEVTYQDFLIACHATPAPKVSTTTVLAPVVVGGIVAAGATFWDRIEGAIAWISNLF